MARWDEFAAQEPELASAARDLLYQHGVGLGYLATVRQDGGPRIHPISPVLYGEGLFALVIPSPKRDDLFRDGRYALHSFPRADSEDAVYVTGSAVEVEEEQVREGLRTRFFEERPNLSPSDSIIEDQIAFELQLDVCLVTLTTGHGDPDPRHLRWSA